MPDGSGRPQQAAWGLSALWHEAGEERAGASELPARGDARGRTDQAAPAMRAQVPRIVSAHGRASNEFVEGARAPDAPVPCERRSGIFSPRPSGAAAGWIVPFAGNL